MKYRLSSRCNVMLFLATATLLGCGENRSSRGRPEKEIDPRRERIERDAKKDYALEEAGNALLRYGGYDKWPDVTVTADAESVTVEGLALRAGAVHDFNVEFQVLESSELRVARVRAKDELLFTVDASPGRFQRPPRSLVGGTVMYEGVPDRGAVVIFLPKDRELNSPEDLIKENLFQWVAIPVEGEKVELDEVTFGATGSSDP